MVLTKAELLSSLLKEVRILLHLAGKVDRSSLDYRPTPKQRSTMELLQYLNVMGPGLVQAIKVGAFDGAAWTAAEEAAKGLSFDETVEAIARHPEIYKTLLNDFTEDDLRIEITMFGNRTTRGACLINLVVCGCAAYRTQLFLYLKACGRDELSTLNLWAGMDAPATV